MRKIFYSLLLCFSAFGSLAQLPFWLPSNGLVAWYPFNGNANDLSGMNNHGLSSGAVLVADRFNVPNSAYSFDGINDHIYIPPSTSLDINGSVSVCAWIKLNTSTIGNQQSQIFWRGDAVSAHDPYALSYNNGLLLFRRDDNYTITRVSYPFSQLTSLEYHHLVGVFDSMTQVYSLYIDGVKVDSLNYVQGSNWPTNQMWNVIGAVDNGLAQNFPGIIDDIAVYNRALDYCEIQRIYQQSSSSIFGQPQSQSVLAGGTIQFQISAPGSSLIYQWQVNTGNGFINVPNNAPYAGSNTNMLTITNVPIVLNNAQFRCIVAGASLCPDTSTAALLNVMPNSITDLAANNLVTVFPNPTEDVLHIEHKGTNKELNYAIFNVAGQQLQNGIWRIDNNRISVKNLPTGIYLLRLVEENGYIRFIRR